MHDISYVPILGSRVQEMLRFFHILFLPWMAEGRVHALRLGDSFLRVLESPVAGNEPIIDLSWWRPSMQSCQLCRDRAQKLSQVADFQV